jgi:ABC-type transport system involved in Fe-S cluster assembly fused permease/ATPase subunit
MPKRRTKVRSNAEEDLRPLDSIVNFQVNSLFKCEEMSSKQLTKRFNSQNKKNNSASIMMAISNPTLENSEDGLNASGQLNKYKSVIGEFH